MIARYLTARTARAVLVAAATALWLAHSPGAQASTEFYITGAGNGHGIGMSQYGAYGYAQHGWTYQHILGHYYQGTGLRTVDPSRTVRVLLGAGNYGPPTVTGASSATAPRAGNHRVQLSTSQRYEMKALSGGNVALYNQAGSQLISARPPIVLSGPGPVNLWGHGRYRGSFEFRWEYGLHVQTVNALDQEDYVRGVISAEMPASWSTQALEAQAVAARTYAITTSVDGNGYGLYCDTRSQMYRGVAAETSSTDSAVAATRGQVVTYRGTPAVTFFFASSGGHTESIQDAWPGTTPEPWLQGVEDTYDNTAGNPYYRWSRSISMSSAAASLGSLVKGTFQGITVTQRGTSPRVVYARINGSGGSTTVTGPQLEGAFGLMSTWISFSTISSNARDMAVRHTAMARTATGFDPLATTRLFLRGRIAPAARGSVLDVQQQVEGRWETAIRGVRVASNGAYSIRLPWPGRYRVEYRGLDGPAVRVG